MSHDHRWPVLPPAATARRAGRRSGFTIVEVLVAMAILLVGMTSVLGLLSFGAAMTRTAALRSAAAGAVEAVVADLEETLFPLARDERTGEWTVGEPASVTDRPVPGHPGVTYSAIPRGDPRDDSVGGPLRYRVDIEMRWSSGGRIRSKTFQTLLLRQVPFGERLRRELIRKNLAPAALPAPKQP